MAMCHISRINILLHPVKVRFEFGKSSLNPFNPLLSLRNHQSVIHRLKVNVIKHLAIFIPLLDNTVNTIDRCQESLNYLGIAIGFDIHIQPRGNALNIIGAESQSGELLQLIYNPQNETCNICKTKRAKFIKRNVPLELHASPKVHFII